MSGTINIRLRVPATPESSELIGLVTVSESIAQELHNQGKLRTEQNDLLPADVSLTAVKVYVNTEDLYGFFRGWPYHILVKVKRVGRKLPKIYTWSVRTGTKGTGINNYQPQSFARPTARGSAEIAAFREAFSRLVLQESVKKGY